MAAGDVFLHRLQFRSHAKVWTVGMHYRDENGADDRFAANDLGDEWAAQYNMNILSLIAKDTTLEAAYTLKVTGTPAMPQLRRENSLVGMHADNYSIPPNSTYVVTQLSTDPQLTRSGRIYMAGIPTSAIVDGNLSDSFKTIAEAIWIAIFTQQLSTSGGLFTPCILRTESGGVPIDPPLAITVESVRLRPIIYTQRRRTSKQRGAAVPRV